VAHQVTIVGGGLAGCEAAWQLAQRGIDVRLIEQKPLRRTPAQVTDELCELVCSNSLRSSNIQNAVGLIKEEMRRLGSLVITAALASRVPAGDALAVERVAFGGYVANALRSHPKVQVVSEIVSALPAEGEVIIATGPLTGDELARDILRVSGQERLYFYDAIAPIISGDSIDRSIVWAQSRYDKGEGADYLNCPLSKEDYDAFVQALLGAECAPLHEFEEPKYFQGCLPVEVVAHSGVDALRWGCMKPVGLRDPRTGKRPYAVVQLRKEDKDGQAYNLVGFQTKLKHPEQKRVLRMIPGLAQAEFLRLGAIHRNTYLDSPTLLDGRMRLMAQPNVRFAGQITGVEGYVESAAHGLVTALLLASELNGSRIEPPPRETALGALYAHVRGETRLPGRAHEPQNVNWSMMPPPPPGTRKSDSKVVRVTRAIERLESWAREFGITLVPGVVRDPAPAEATAAVS
jgi:methylenetetrahydrofolate--tRNA-(uracil-5-)-methyltransferase